MYLVRFKVLLSNTQCLNLELTQKPTSMREFMLRDVGHELNSEKTLALQLLLCPPHLVNAKVLVGPRYVKCVEIKY